MAYRVDHYKVYLNREPVIIKADLPEPVNFTTPDEAGGTGEAADTSTSSGEVALGKGKTVPALFTCYGPEANGRWKPPNGGGTFADGGSADAALARGELCCAAPPEFGPVRKNRKGKAIYPWGTKIQIAGTGTQWDGRVFTVRDHGGAIQIKNGVWHFDLLMTKAQRDKFGKHNGKAVILGVE